MQKEIGLTRETASLADMQPSGAASAAPQKDQSCRGVLAELDQRGELLVVDHEIDPVFDVSAMLSLVRSSWLCTILPPSSVRRDVEAGLLVTVPIRRDEIPGALSIIFSADRSLSEAERIIIREMMIRSNP